MTASTRQHPPPATAPARPVRGWLAGALIVLLGVVAYHNSFSVPFVFDDLPAIVENASLRRLGALGEVLFPATAGGLTTSGRPVLNLSFALNYAMSGYAPWSYHAVNLAIHLAAGLLLLGLVRRTLIAPPLAARFGGAALPLATAVAAIWTLHPLQTESVTYVVQRAESLAGFFFLLTLYGYLRAVAPEPGVDARPGRGAAAGIWSVVCVGACLLGMGTKETVVGAPLIALLYDRTFVSGSFAAAWARHRRLLLALAATWLVLALLVARTAGRGGTAGFDAGVSVWTYALTQCRALVQYLWLSVWPAGLSFDYGLGTARGLGEVLPQALVVVGIVAATGWALWRRPVWGFAGALLLAALAPSSSFVPIATQTMAEHRMYLALAAVVAVAVIGAFGWAGRRALAGAALAAVACTAATVARNHDYRSELVLWGDTAAKQPGNARAHNNLGQALYRAGDVAGSVARYRRALALQPKYPETHYNLGVALARLDDLPGALAHYEQALRLQPAYPEAHNNRGNALVRAGRIDDALAHYAEARRLRPDFAEAHNNTGNALLQLGRPAEARPHFQRALEVKPGYAEACYNLGNAHAALGQMGEALAQFRAALALAPDYAEAHVNAGNALLALDRPVEAVAHYQRGAALSPRLPDAHYNLGSALLALERWAEAVPGFETALRLQPDFHRAERGLGFALAQLGRSREALPHYEKYLRAVPDDAEARAEWSQLRGSR